MTNDEIRAWCRRQWEEWIGQEWEEKEHYEVVMMAFDAIKAVLEIHTPHKIYDECEHEHGYDDPALIDTGDFTTCQEAWMYDICRACCTAGLDNDQTEDCASDHRHGPVSPICPTVDAIAICLRQGVSSIPGRVAQP